MYNPALLHSKTFLIKQFDIHKINAGITTCSLGDFRLRDNAIKGKLDHIKGFCQADIIAMLTPIHETDVQIVNNLSNDKFYPIDSIISGNKKIGYIGLIHCSWITLSKKIIDRTINTILEEIRIPITNLKAFIYPGICQCCYKVMSDVKLQFNEDNDNAFFKQTYSNHWLLDLSGYIKQRLVTLGIRDKNIRTISSCSAHSIVYDSDDQVSSPVFYSHRARKDQERNLVFARHAHSPIILGGLSGDCPYVLLYSL